MQKIKLSTGEFTSVDDADFHKYKSFRCFPATPKKGKYRYAQIRLNNKTQYLHRVIMGAVKGLLVDHIDHDTLNNQRSNLRLVSAHGNQMNAAGRSNISGFSNVRKMGLKFQGRVKVMGKKISVGCFDTALQAAQAVLQFKKLRLEIDKRTLTK
jgi:hypothetical protein